MPPHCQKYPPCDSLFFRVIHAICVPISLRAPGRQNSSLEYNSLILPKQAGSLPFPENGETLPEGKMLEPVHSLLQLSHTEVSPGRSGFFRLALRFGVKMFFCWAWTGM
jgi:hypothetical protein